MLKVWVDADVCLQHDACGHRAPEVFVLGDAAFARVKVNGRAVEATKDHPAEVSIALREAVMRGAGACPVRAIHVSAGEEVSGA